MSGLLHVLVTGASGFVGTALVRHLLSGGHQVTVLARHAAPLPAGVQLVQHALGSGAALVLPVGVNAVAHLAQSRAYRAFPGDAEEMFRVNVAGTHELLKAAAVHGVSRFCMVSSGTVYEPFTGTLAEDAALAPTSNLGATKLVAEVLARPYGALMKLSILRLFMPYGPGQTARLVPDLIRRVAVGEAVTLPATGGGLGFTPSYVDDVCAVLAAALTEGWSGVYNVASPEVITIEQAARTIGAALGKVPVFARADAVPGATLPPTIAPDLTRLAAVWPLDRFRSFADGVAATLAGEQ